MQCFHRAQGVIRWNSAPLPLSLSRPAVAQRGGELVRLAAVGYPGDEVLPREAPLASHPCCRNLTLAGEGVDRSGRHTQECRRPFHVQDFPIHRRDALPPRHLRRALAGFLFAAQSMLLTMLYVAFQWILLEDNSRYWRLLPYPASPCRRGSVATSRAHAGKGFRALRSLQSPAGTDALARARAVAFPEVSAPGRCQTAFVSPGRWRKTGLPYQRFSSLGKAREPSPLGSGVQAGETCATRLSTSRHRHTLNLSEARPRRASRSGRRETASRLRVSEDSCDRRQSFLLLPHSTMSSLCPR